MESDEELGVQFKGPAGLLLEDIREQMFDKGGFCSRFADDPRTEAIYEQIAYWLAEQTAAGTVSPRGGGTSTAGSPLWAEYVRRTLVSIQRRAHLTDARGAPRVVNTFHSGGSLWHVDLSDWRGRHRVRVLYDAAGACTEVRLISGCGEELRYVPTMFGTSTSVLRTHLERARMHCAQLSHQPASKAAEQRARKSVEHLFAAALLPSLERLIQLEVEEGRQLVPLSEDLVEMDVEQIIELLELA